MQSEGKEEIAVLDRFLSSLSEEEREEFRSLLPAGKIGLLAWTKHEKAEDTVDEALSGVRDVL